MRLALSSEFGACAVYGLLARRMKDVELAQVLAAFQQEEREQIERLRDVIRELGGRAPRRSLRRSFMAVFSTGPRFSVPLGLRCDRATSRVHGPALVPRLCGYLAAIELPGPARACELWR